MEQNDLEKYFYNNSNRLINKWEHYFSIYDRYFKKYREKPVIILEIGVFHGGSLQMWKNYFGENTIIYGIDIDPRCKELEEENITIFIGSQSDKSFLQEVKSQIPKVDIIIDDGGHTMKQQRVSFEELIDHVKEGGIYLCEDCHTSYWPVYGGGYKRKGTFIEYSKSLIDKLNAWHTEEVHVDRITQNIRSISFYDSIVVFEKQTIEKPESLMRGVPSFELSNNVSIETSNKSLFSRIKQKLSSTYEKILAFLKLPSRI